MSIDPDDPRLTRYALGEMDAQEREAFVRELQADPAARAELDQIRALGARLEASFAREPAPALTEEQRAAFAQPAAAPRRSRRRRLVPLAAALLAAAGTVVWFATRSPERYIDPEIVARPPEAMHMERYNDLNEREMRNPGAVTVKSEEEGSAPVLGAPAPGDPGTQRYANGVAKAPLGAPAPGAPALGDVPVRGYLTRGGDEDDREPFHTEAYDRIVDNDFRRTESEDVSTFSIDVDTAAYANVRRFLNGKRLPPKDAVRIEELINYFPYSYAPPPPGSPHPFATHVEVATCPWNAEHRLARIALKGQEIAATDRPASNLVFLIDVSGSMEPQNKLPLLKRSLEMLVENLNAHDRVAIAVYAGSSGLVLDSTPGDRQPAIREALERLKAGGSTNGGAGIELAYAVAARNFIRGGVNRVILCTDGDFNVGVTDRGALTRLIEEKAKGGVFLSVLGFGTGNLKDATMEELSNRGNGNYAYIDSLNEARKVLVEQAGGTLVTIAKDVKIQVFFNPEKVAGWRLVGYVNRKLAKEDFNDDTKDAGEIGAGHAVTALYELVPAGHDVPGVAHVDANPFVREKKEPVGDRTALFRLRLRYKRPDGDSSTLLEEDVQDGGGGFDAASGDFRWAACVAGFGMLLRESPHLGGMTYRGVMEVAEGAVGADPGGYRREFVRLCGQAAGIAVPRKLEQRPAAPLGSRVTAAADDRLELSLGRVDGLAVGDTVHLRRGATYLGRAKIVKLDETQSTAAFETATMTMAGRPRAGDEVYRTTPAPYEPPTRPASPAWARVPAGLVLPGTTRADYEARHRRNDILKRELVYEVWGDVPAFELPAFSVGRREVTNAQWKRYLDAEFRVERVTGAADTLRGLAAAYVKFRGEGDASEWKAIYACNLPAIVAAWQENGKWDASWDPVDPPPSIADLPLAPGVKLTFYRHRIPEHWYGWCKLSGLRVGREYCDVDKPWNEAFRVPDTLKLRAGDFAAYPIRGISPNEALAFAEWAGCELPTEYEFERAGRGDNLHWQFPFGPVWDHAKERNLFPWGDSPAFPVDQGPFPVDDARAAGSDAPCGARMMLGNVWELTRTFFDLHPDVMPAPPPPEHGLQNYALVAKGGSWGDGAVFCQLSARPCRVGAAELSLRYQNKVDSLGIRLVRHDAHPGYDLLLHSILRLSYDAGTATWNTYVPHAFAMPLMAGVDRVDIVDCAAPYAHVQGRAKGVAFAPLWIAERRPDESGFLALGVLRADVPLRAGIRLSAQEARELLAARERYARDVEAYKRLPQAKQQQTPPPEPPPEPDAFEKETAGDARALGLWREEELPPGEWIVGTWNGWLALADKTLGMPPRAILRPDRVARVRAAPVPAQLALEPDADRITLRFRVNEQAADRRHERHAPREDQSSLWALCEVQPERWTGGAKGLKERPWCWEVEVSLPASPGALGALGGR